MTLHGQCDSLTEAEIRTLAERAYPDLRSSGFCSRHHPSMPPDVSCTICFTDLNGLVAAHNELKQAAWKALRDVRDELSNGVTANFGFIEKRIREGLNGS